MYNMQKRVDGMQNTGEVDTAESYTLRALSHSSNNNHFKSFTGVNKSIRFFKVIHLAYSAHVPSYGEVQCCNFEFEYFFRNRIQILYKTVLSHYVYMLTVYLSLIRMVVTQ